ncbi:hypothetical protein NXY55_08180 [Aeromonas veronii]|nr:hypothetical protein [Aeromonas veronii]
MEIEIMKFIQHIVNNIGSGSAFREWSNEERLKLLSIDNDKQETIKKLLFKKVSYDDKYKSNTGFKVIKITSLVGINRNERVDDWLELLFDLHKKNIFNNYKDRDTFINYVLGLNSTSEDLPHVLAVGNKYYIDGNGKHRLTIAKCLEIDEFPVFVSKVTIYKRIIRRIDFCCMALREKYTS